jgi:hypothetical protein
MALKRVPLLGLPLQLYILPMAGHSDQYVGNGSLKTKNFAQKFYMSWIPKESM